MSEPAQQEYSHPFQKKSREHRVLAPHSIRYPAEERARDAIENAVDRKCKREGGQGQAEDAHRHIGDLEIPGDRRQLGRRHQAPRRHQHEHGIHDPEHRRGGHLQRSVVAPRWGGVHRAGNLERRIGLAQEPAQHEHDQTLGDTEIQERRLVAARIDHRGKRNHGEGGAGAESHRSKSRRQPAPIGKQFQCLTDAGPVYGTGADSTQGRRQVEQEKRVCNRVQSPRQADQKSGNHDHPLRAEAVHEIALHRHQPGFGEHENSKCHLDRWLAPVEFVVDRIDEQRPAVLKIGDHRHADDADDQLPPATGRGGTHVARRDCPRLTHLSGSSSGARKIVPGFGSDRQTTGLRRCAPIVSSRSGQALIILAPINGGDGVADESGQLGPGLHTGRLFVRRVEVISDGF